MSICPFPGGNPSKVTTVLLLPECQKSRPPCVALSLSLTAPEDGKWCQSIHQSNTGGCAEESWGRGNGSVQEERSTWLWLPAATISPYRCSWCCSALMDWLPVHPSVHSYKRFLWSVLRGRQWQSVVLWECLKGPLPSISICSTVSAVFWTTLALKVHGLLD